MKLTDIFEQWDQDAQIDSTNLFTESLGIAKLYTKYMKISIGEKIKYGQMKDTHSKLYVDKVEYYRGTLDLDAVKSHGWDPQPKIILKADVPSYLEADDEMQGSKMKLLMQEEKIDALIAILKLISNRSYHINNALDTQKFLNGVNG